MNELINKFLYDSEFFYGCIGIALIIIAIPGAIYLLYRFVIESRDLKKRMKGFEFPGITIRKAEYEWAKDYLEQKKKDKENK